MIVRLKVLMAKRTIYIKLKLSKFKIITEAHQVITKINVFSFLSLFFLKIREQAGTGNKDF